MSETDTPPTTEPAVLLIRHDGWAEIVLNRPQRRNAIDGALADDFHQALSETARDESLRAVVLRGAGGALCSGLDLKAFNAEPKPAWVPGFNARWRDVHVALASTRQVLVVALERFAINGGAALAIAGDVLVCGRGATLQIGEVRLGMFAPNNLAWLLMRHAESVAARLALLGDKVGADELLRLGVATEVVDDDQVTERCQALAREIAQWPAANVQALKSALRRSSVGPDIRQWFESFAQPGSRPPPTLGEARLRT